MPLLSNISAMPVKPIQHVAFRGAETADVSLQLNDITKVRHVAVVNLLEGQDRLHAMSAVGAMNNQLNGAIMSAMRQQTLTGQLNEVQFFSAPDQTPVMVIGIGPQKEWNKERVSEISETMVTKAAEKGFTTVSTILHGTGLGGLEPKIALDALKEGVAKANETLKAAGKTAVKVVVVINNPKMMAELKQP